MAERRVDLDAEVVVVGGGPVGLATAIAARRHGLSAVVLEARRRPALDKACGEGLMPDAVAALRRLAVEPHPLGQPFVGIVWRDDCNVATGRFPDGPGIGIRRPVLHAALVAAAEAAGVGLRWGWRATRLAGPATVGTSRGPVRGRFVVGADGLHSPVRAWVGLAGRPARRHRHGVRRHFAMPPWGESVEVTWGEGAEAYVTPVAADEVGVALLWEGPARGFDDLLERFPELRRRLAGHRQTSRDRGAGRLRQGARAVTRGRVALVGDAAGYVDAITGEGLGVGLRAAEALGEALARDDLDGYARHHRRIVRLPEALTRLLLAFEVRPAFRRRLVAAFARSPELFSRVLALHVGALPPSRFGLRSAAGLARELLRG